MPLTTAVAQDFNIFPVATVWSYFGTSSDTTFCLNGTGWEQPGFDDSPWPTGPGGFTGGEDGDPGPGPLAFLLNTTSLPAPYPSSGRPQYFRTHFNLASTNDLTLVLSNRIDEQAVFYINGTRVADYRHPDNPESCDPGGAGGDEATVWVVITLTPAMLANVIHAGDNVIAVSVHQNATSSPDMVFVCIMDGTTAPPPPPVGPIAFTNGTGVITFETPPPVQQWSTIVGSGRDSGFDGTTDATIAAMDTAAKTNDASIINVPLASRAGNPAAADNGAVYASDAGAQYIQTRPTGNAYTRVMATLTNISGGTLNCFGIRYNLKVLYATIEQAYGHLVYYSTTGTPGSWTQISYLNDQMNDAVVGTHAKCAVVDLSSTPWFNNTKLYILWCDDNANPSSPDATLGIDDVQFVACDPGHYCPGIEWCDVDLALCSSGREACEKV